MPRGSLRQAAGLAVLAGVGLGLPASAEAQDLGVTNVEVTQGVQRPNNSIGLVERRSTAVRATVAANFLGLRPRPVSVTGRLHVFRNGVPITPTGGLPPIAPAQISPFPIAPILGGANQGAMLNFELPAPTNIRASNNVDFRVDVPNIAPERNLADNTGFANDLRFEDGTTPRLRFLRVDYTPAGAGPPLFSLINPGVGDAFVKGILPVNDGAPGLYARLPGQLQTFGRDDDSDGQIDGNIERDTLLTVLSIRRVLSSPFGVGFGALDQDFLYGWVRGNPIPGNGWAPVGGRVAFGNTQTNRHQRTYAHELIHNFGLNHNSRTIDRVGWDVGSRLGGNPAGNGIAAGERIKPTTLNDIMVGGQLTNSAWVDTQTYNFLLGSPTLNSLEAADAGQHAAPAKTPAAITRPRRGLLVVHGIMNPRGTKVLRLEPAFRYPWRSQPTARPESAPFTLVVESEKGTTRTRFSAMVASETGIEENGFFEVIAPAGLGIRSIRILDRSGRAIMTRRGAGQAPRVRVLPIPARALRGGRAQLRWTAEDPDSRARDLRFQVAYSPNNGRSFVPVATTTNKTAVTFDVDALPRGKGRSGVFRVFASDGLHSAFADLRGVAVPGARGAD